MRLQTFLLCGVILIMGCPGYAQQEPFPFVAEVTAERVHVRAGQSRNFESLCRLERGERVIVLDKKYSWYKVKLPPNARNFVSRAYVQLVDENTGEVQAARVNVRAGKGMRYSVLGQLNQGDQVQILETHKDWFRIAPIPGGAGWIKEDLIVFKSKDMEAYQQEPSLAAVKETSASNAKKQPLNQSIPREKILKKSSVKAVKAGQEAGKSLETSEPLAQAPSALTVVGRLRRHPASLPDQRYTILINNRLQYYVQAAADILDPFVNHQVTLEGVLREDKTSAANSSGTVMVSRIELVL